MKKVLLIISLMVAGFTVKAQNNQQDVPSTVLKGFSQKYPDVNMNEVKWDTKGDLYKAIFSKGKSDYKVLVNNKGQWMSSEIDDLPAAEIPAEVRDGLEKSEYGKWNISDIEAKEKPGETIYKIEVESGMADEEVYINQEGERVAKNRYTQKIKNKS